MFIEQKRYLFLGGPWHGRTEYTKDEPTVAIQAPVAPSISSWSKGEYKSPTFSVSTYFRKEFGFPKAGIKKYIYAYEDLSIDEVDNLFAEFISKLFDIYVEA